MIFDFENTQVSKKNLLAGEKKVWFSLDNHDNKHLQNKKKNILFVIKEQ